MQNLNKIKKISLLDNDIISFHNKFKEKYNYSGIKIKKILNEIYNIKFPHALYKNHIDTVIILGITNKNEYVLVDIEENKEPFIFSCPKRYFNNNYKKNLIVSKI